MTFYAIQTVMGILGSIGFAILFGVFDRKLLWISLGSGAGWGVYLLCTANGHSMFLLPACLWRYSARFWRES